VTAAEESQLDYAARTNASVRALRDERDALVVRRDELLELVARLSQSTPLDSEVAEALEQRGALIAEVGTLRSRVTELELELELARRAR
jgi:hypothetical protein